MMPSHRLPLLTVAVALLAARPARAQQPSDLSPYLMNDRAAEIALARTAAPRNISDSASVIVLTKAGFVEAVHGTNGFTCMVQRSFFAGFSDPNFWYAENRSPVCINAPAVRTVLPEILKRGEWIMSGLSAKEVAKRTKEGYASHTFPMPAPGAMAYMLSPEQILAPTKPHWMPHLMFYFDKSSPAGAWGMGIRLLLVPVRRWSDGKPAMQ
jgi:hypothetical protein